MTPREFWNRYLRAYDAINMNSDYCAYLDSIARKLCLRPSDTILDAGSGTGNLSIRMRRLGARVTSLDFSPVALMIHRGKDPSAILVQSSLESPLPFPDDEFDGISCTSVLFTLSRIGARLALREFKRVLKPGGRLLVTASKKRMSVLKSALDHLRSRCKVQSLVSFLREARRTLVPMFRLIYYCFRARSLRRQGRYRRFTGKELAREILGARFTQLRCESTFGGRFHLVEATAPWAAAIQQESPKGRDGSEDQPKNRAPAGAVAASRDSLARQGSRAPEERASYVG